MVKLLNCFARRVVAMTSCLCRRLRVLHAQSSVQPLWTARQTDLPAVTLREISKWRVGWILDVSSWCEFMSTQMATKQMKSNCYLNPIQLQTESKLTPPCCSFITISTHQSCFEDGKFLRVAADLFLIAEWTISKAMRSQGHCTQLQSFRSCWVSQLFSLLWL